MKRFMSIAVTIVIMCSVLIGAVYAGSKPTARFKDVKDSDWFAEAVEKMNTMKIIDGMPGGSFNPKGEVTRAQFVKMLVQAMEYKKVDAVSFNDLKPFSDSKPHWACVYIETALRNGVIVKSEIGENFFPDVPLTRKDMGIMMLRALKLTSSEGENPFADLTEANGYLTKLYEEYLIRGSIEGGKRLYKPEGLTTRAEAAVIMARMVEYKAELKGFVEKSAMEERFANGTQTAEDIAAKRAAEIAKAKADPNYIMEPMFKIVNDKESIRNFNLMAGGIGILNFEGYLKYTPECQFKIVCTNGDKDLLNKATRLTQPFVSYDHRYEVRTDIWNNTKDSAVKDSLMGSYIIKYIMRDEERTINGKWVDVPDYVKVGETLNFKLYIKRGSNVQEYDIDFKVN